MGFRVKDLNLLLKNPSLLVLQSGIRFQSEHPTMHFLLHSEVSKQLWLAVMKKSCFRFPFRVLLRFKPFITLLQRAKKMFQGVSQSWRSLRDIWWLPNENFIYFRFVFFPPWAHHHWWRSKCAFMRWKVLVCWHSSSFILSRRERKLFHFLLPSRSLGPRVAEFSPEIPVSTHHFPPICPSCASQTQSLLVSDPVHARCLAFPCTHCVRALMGILLHIWLSRRYASASL